MHRRKFAPAVMLLLLLWLGLISACSSAQKPDDILSGLDLQELAGQPVVDLRDKELTAEQYHLLKEQLPDSEILWNVPFQGATYASDIRDLMLTSLSEEDAAQLSLFPKLEHIDATNCPDYTVLVKLADQRPDLQIQYQIPFCGESVSSDATELTIPGNQPTAEMEKLSYFRALTAVTLAEPLPAAQQIRELQKAFPEVRFCWSLDFHGIELSESTQTLDLTGIPVTAEEVEHLISYLPQLTWLDLSDCGIDNGQLDALNRKYESVQIVWTVSIGPFIQLKTDATWFMPTKLGYKVNTEDVYNLRYCTDIVALDLGHMKISNCDFVAFMPRLKYLILADTNVTDLTPLTGLKELAFLELFLTDIQDYTPLETLTGLEDLNIYYTYGDAEVILRMTWLKNLWWNGCSPQNQKLLREAMPDCRFSFGSFSSTGDGWRKLPNYYAQRDIFGMSYMTG